jgi:transcriptional regulator with XRE-family HTH domain
MVNISEKISSLRKAHNLTQESLGEAVGVSPQAVSKWEKGDSLPDISVIPDLCRIFGISADILLGNEGNMTSEMYVDKALEICKGEMDEKIRLLYKIMADGVVKKETVTDYYLASTLWDAHTFSIADSRGFGMFFNDMEYVKKMMDVDFSTNKLLNFITDEKAIKIFMAICINGSLDESQIIKATAFSKQEVTERLYSLMKYSLIESAMNKINGSNEMAFTMAQHGILLLGIIANLFLFAPESRTGKGTICGQRNTNPEKQQMFIKQE